MVYRTFKKQSLGLALATFGCLLGSSAALAAGAAQTVIGAEWVSAPSAPTSKTVDMRTLPAAPKWKPGDPIIEIPRRFHGDINAPVPVPANPVYGDDPLLSRQEAFNTRSMRAFNAPIVNRDVIASAAVSPNDPTGDIGPLQFVASINSSSGASFAVYDKDTGAVVGPASVLMESLGTGGSCSAGLGDPIVLFDELANRWVLTEFTDGANVLCVYLSDVADLSGPVTWTRYSFTLPTFPDYPKYGVWPDAYYVGANENNALYAMDRVKMLAGQPATLQRFSAPTLAGFNFQMIQPADIAGTTLPPVGSPGIFVRHNDDESHTPATNNPSNDFLEMFEFRVDWATPANSAITGPVRLPIAEFSSNLNGLTAFNAFPQPNAQKLDPLRETVMHRLTYRNFGSYEALVGNFTTDLFLGAGSTYPDDTGGVRWFELRRQLGPQDGVFADGFESVVRGANPVWTLYQEGTWAPSDGTPAEQADRWMAGTSIDESGNIALAYNIVRQSPAISAGVRYTGRLSSDPLGVMGAGEATVVDGSGSISGQRWGDYNDMGIDPVDGCTFWFVGNYVSGGARANRAASFKFDECGLPAFTLTSPAPSVAVCANNASPTNAPAISLNATATNGFVGAVDLTFPNAFPTGVAGNFTPATIPALPGSSSVQLSATNAATPGTAAIVARGTSGGIVRDVNLSLSIATASPAAPPLTAPANSATGVATTPTFTWTAAAQAASYTVEAATEATFAAPLFSQQVVGTSLVSPVALPTNTEIFWRVTPTNGCGTGTVSSTFSFTTNNLLCNNTQVAIPDNNTAGVTSTIVVPPGAPNIGAVKISVDATHTWVGDLALTLSKDGGAAISVYSPSSSCQGDNMDVSFFDTAVGTANTCANATPAVSGEIKPVAAFAPLNGASATGTWSLKVVDRAGQDTGTLNGWCLEF